MGRIFKNYTVKHKRPTSRQRVSFQRLLMLFVVCCFILFLFLFIFFVAFITEVLERQFKILKISDK